MNQDEVARHAWSPIVQAATLEIRSRTIRRDYGCPVLLIGQVFINGVQLFPLKPIVLGDASKSRLELYWSIDNVAVDQIRACRYGDQVYWVHSVGPNGEPSFGWFDWILISFDARIYETAFEAGDSRKLEPLTDVEFSSTVRQFLDLYVRISPDDSEYCIPALCDDASGRSFLLRLHRALYQSSEQFSVSQEVRSTGGVTIGYRDSELSFDLGVSEAGGCLRFTAPIAFPLWITNRAIHALYTDVEENLGTD